MAKPAPAPAPISPTGETAITLLKPHTHAGHDYPAGAQLTLAADSAAWLIRIGTARLTAHG